MKFKKKITSLVVLSAFSATQCGFLEAVAAGKSNTSGSLLGSLFKKIYSTDASKSKNKNKKRSLKNNKKNIKAKNKESFKQIVKSAAAENKKSKEKVVSPKVKNKNSVKKTKNNVTSEESNSKLRKTPEKFEISLEKTELADEVGKANSESESLSIPEKSKENIKEVNESIAKKGETKTVDPFDGLFNDEIYGSDSKKSKNSSNFDISFLKNLDLGDAIIAASLAFFGAYVVDKKLNSGKMSNSIRRQFFNKQEKKDDDINSNSSGTISSVTNNNNTNLLKAQAPIENKVLKVEEDESKLNDVRPIDFFLKSGYLPYSVTDVLWNNKGTDLIVNGNSKKFFELVADRTYSRSYSELIQDWIVWISNPRNHMGLKLAVARNLPWLFITPLSYISPIFKELSPVPRFSTNMLVFVLVPLVVTCFLYGKFEPIVALQRIFDRSGSWYEDLALVVRDIIRIITLPAYSIFSGFGNVGKHIYYEGVPFNSVSEGVGGAIKGTWENLVPAGYYFSRFVDAIRWLFGKSSDAFDLISYVDYDGKKSTWVLYNGVFSLQGSYKASKLNDKLNFFNKGDGRVNVGKIFEYAKKQIILKLDSSEGEAVDPLTKKVTKKEVADEKFLEFLKLPWWEFNDWIGIMPKRLRYIHDKVLGKLIEFSKTQSTEEAKLVKRYLENTKMYGKTLEQLREYGYVAYKNKLLEIQEALKKELKPNLESEKNDLLKKLDGKELAKLFVMLYNDQSNRCNKKSECQLFSDVFVFASNCDDSDDFFNDEKVKKIIDSVYGGVKKEGKIENGFELFVTLKKDINFKKLVYASNWIFNKGSVDPVSKKEKSCEKLLEVYFEYFIRDDEIYKEVMEEKSVNQNNRKAQNSHIKNRLMRKNKIYNEDENVISNNFILDDSLDFKINEERSSLKKSKKKGVFSKDFVKKIVSKLWKNKEGLIKEIRKEDPSFDVKEIENDESVLTLVQKLKIEKLLPGLELSPKGIALLYSNICDEEKGFESEEDEDRYSRISSVLFEFLDEKGKKEVDNIRNNVKKEKINKIKNSVKKFAKKVLELFMKKFVLDKDYSDKKILEDLESLLEDYEPDDNKIYAARVIINNLADHCDGKRFTNLLTSNITRDSFIKVLKSYYICRINSLREEIYKRKVVDNSADILVYIAFSPYYDEKGKLFKDTPKAVICNNFVDLFANRKYNAIKNLLKSFSGLSIEKFVKLLKLLAPGRNIWESRKFFIQNFASKFEQNNNNNNNIKNFHDSEFANSNEPIT